MSGYGSTQPGETALVTGPESSWPPPAPQEQVTPPNRSLSDRLRWVIPGGALVFGLAVGVSLGVTALAADPTRSDEYRTLQAQSDDLTGEVQELEGRVQRADDRATTAEDRVTTAEAQASQAVAEADRRQAELDEREQAVADREAAVTAVENQIAATSIGEGIWTVGVDIEPGTYRTADPLAGYCYWAIYRSGTNGDDIVENDGPEGGYPTVTLSEGQDFENSGCGTFVKQ